MFLKHCLAQELFSKHWEDVSKVLRWQFRLPDSNQASWGLRGEVRKLILSSEKSKPFIPQIPNLCSISACSVYFFMSCSYSTSFCSWENSKIYDDDDLIVKTWNSHKRHDIYEHVDRYTLEWNMFSTGSLRSKWTWQRTVLWNSASQEVTQLPTQARTIYSGTDLQGILGSLPLTLTVIRFLHTWWKVTPCSFCTSFPQVCRIQVLLLEMK